MARIVKTDKRRIEIIRTAEKLFNEKGFARISVESIIQTIGVANGTFYYYFKSKEEVLKAIVDLQIEKIAAISEQVADDLSDHLHLSGNRELHEEINIQTVIRLSPVFVKIIAPGAFSFLN